MAEELQMLEIALVGTTDRTATYALSGEITMDQLERIEALIRDTAAQNRSVTFDLQHVWRIDRDAAFLFARHVCRPDDRVRMVGVPEGLLEWLRAFVDEVPEPERSRLVREGGVAWKS